MWLDPGRLAARHLTAGDVVAALREQNIQVAAGSLGDAPASPDQMFNLSVRALGRLSEAAEFGNIVVERGVDGALVRVSDIGRVELGAETYSSRLRFMGLEASGLGIQPLPSANALEVDTAIRKEMERLAKNFPPGLIYKIAFENTSVVRESIKEVLKTLAEAIGLVILVMFLFLQNWRTTIIPAVTIPVADGRHLVAACSPVTLARGPLHGGDARTALTAAARSLRLCRDSHHPPLRSFHYSY